MISCIFLLYRLHKLWFLANSKFVTALDFGAEGTSGWKLHEHVSKANGSSVESQIVEQRYCFKVKRFARKKLRNSAWDLGFATTLCPGECDVPKQKLQKILGSAQSKTVSKVLGSCSGYPPKNCDCCWFLGPFQAGQLQSFLENQISCVRLQPPEGMPGKLRDCFHASAFCLKDIDLPIFFPCVRFDKNTIETEKTDFPNVQKIKGKEVTTSSSPSILRPDDQKLQVCEAKAPADCITWVGCSLGHFGSV